MERIKIIITEPCNVEALFHKPVNYFCIKNEYGKCYFERKSPSIIGREKWFFNIEDKGTYYIYSQSPICNIKKTKIKVWTPLPLPKPDHNYYKKVKLIKQNINSSPASIKPRTGHIYINSSMESMPIYKQRFIMAHERGHFFYSGSGNESEENCDLFAINWVMAHGGNLSGCYATLKDVLKRSETNLQRMRTFIENLKLTYNHG